MTKIIDVAKTAIQAVTVGYEIYMAVAKHMDAVQVDNGLSGIEKKNLVIDFIHKTFDEVANNWTFWFTAISKFIDSIKTIYNIVKAH